MFGGGFIVWNFPDATNSISFPVFVRVEKQIEILEPAPQGMGAPFRGRYGNDTEMEFVRAVPVPKTGFPVPWPGTIPGTIMGWRAICSIYKINACRMSRAGSYRGKTINVYYPNRIEGRLPGPCGTYLT